MVLKHPIIADQNSVGLGQGRAQLFRPDLSSANWCVCVVAGFCFVYGILALCVIAGMVRCK